MKPKSPVELGQVIELCITGLTDQGWGVGRYAGFTIFVPEAIPEEVIKAKVTLVKKTYAHAKIVEIMKAHPKRVPPPCSLFSHCGGCQFQHLSYPEQLKYKRQIIIDHFERIGGLTNITVHPVLGMSEPWFYRNKAQVPVGMKHGKIVAGFYRARTHEIADMELCLIQHPQNDAAVREVKRLLQMFHLSPYDEKKHRGLIRHIFVRIGVKSQELMVVLVTNGKTLPREKEFVTALVRTFPHLRSVIQNINTQRTNVILGPKNRLLYGREYILDSIGDIRFAISAHSFYQVNPAQTEVLYQQVKRYAKLTGQETVMDVYCGIGTIALYLANDAKKVYGIEIVPDAVKDAKYNAKLNEIKNVEFVQGAAEKILPVWRKMGKKADVVIVDPPRKGCHEELLKAVASMAPKRWIYVSCNSATLARDARRMADLGYELVEIQPVDMFPQTSHVECCALFLPSSSSEKMVSSHDEEGNKQREAR